MDLAILRAEVRRLSIELARARAGVAAGLSTDAGRGRVLNDATETLSWDAVAFLREQRRSAEGRRAARLGHLETRIIDLMLHREASAQLDEFDRRMHRWDIGRGPYSSDVLLLAEEEWAQTGNRDARIALAQYVQNELVQLNVILEQAWDRQRPVLEEAGRRVPADRLREASDFLAATEAMYLDVAGWWVERSTVMDPFPHGAEAHDLAYALSLAPFEGLFPRGEAARGLTARLEEGGFEGAVRLDGALREGKQSRAEAIGIDPPEEITAIYRATGGSRGARAALRAWGEAIHRAHVEPERPFEDRALGDQALPAAWGALFQNLLLEPKWLRATFRDLPPDLPRLFALVELARLRRLCAGLLCRADLERDGVGAGVVERCADRLSTALGARWPSSLILSECGPAASVELDIEAASFEAILRLTLRDRFDEDWWANPRAILFARQIFSLGQLESCREVAKTREMRTPSLLAAVPRFEELLS